MGSAGSPCADALGGLQPLNGQLYQHTVAPRRLGLEATSTTGYCHLYKLGSIGSAYWRFLMLIYPAGHLCAVVIDGPRPTNGLEPSSSVERMWLLFGELNLTSAVLPTSID